MHGAIQGSNLVQALRFFFSQLVHVLSAEEASNAIYLYNISNSLAYFFASTGKSPFQWNQWFLCPCRKVE